MSTAGIAVIVTGLVIAAGVIALTAATRWVIREDYKVSLTGPSLKVEKRSLPVTRPAAPRVVIVPGDGVPDALTKDIVVRGGKF
jgi:hypothetical protein